jgi:hypothetical protein
MKPFNLKRALAGDPVVTKDGIKVDEIFYPKSIKNYEDEESAVIAIIRGRINVLDINTDYLLMDNTFKKLWINIYKSHGKDNYWCSGVHDSEHEAKNCIADEKIYLKTVSFEVEQDHV